MRQGERGYSLVIVLILLAYGGLVITPTLRLAQSSLRTTQIHSSILDEQYARDGAAEHAMWELVHGSATTLLDDAGQCPGQICTYTVDLNGQTVSVSIKKRTTLSSNTVGGAEDNRIRATVTVVCDDLDADTDFDDDCGSLPKDTSGMIARYTVTLDQLSPDTSAGLTDIYAKTSEEFYLRTGTVTSTDGSFPEIATVTPTDVDSDAVWEIQKWSFSPPITFLQDQKRVFSYDVDISTKEQTHCNQILLKLEQPPNERSGKMAKIVVGPGASPGCKGGGLQVNSLVDTLVITPNVNTVFTYIINVENVDQGSFQIKGVKDTLAQGGFKYCHSPAFPPDDFLLTCDPPMYKRTADPFDPATDSFTNTAGFTTISQDPTQTLTSTRWELFWDDSTDVTQGLDKADDPFDTFIMRFQVHATLAASGSYYNEVFIDLDCSVPSPLLTEGVTTADDYCSPYSWPSGGSIVPAYDTQTVADTTIGQGNVSLGSGAGDSGLESWHVEGK